MLIAEEAVAWCVPDPVKVKVTLIVYGLAFARFTVLVVKVSGKSVTPEN